MTNRLTIITQLHRFLLTPAFAIAAFAFLGLPTGKAELVLDNTSSSPEGLITATSTAWIAQGFTTSAGAWTLDDVSMRIQQLTGGGNLLLSIHQDSGSNAPGSLLADLSGNSAPTTAALYTYSPTASLSLLGNTTYWVVGRVTSGGARYRFTRVPGGAPYSTADWSVPTPRSLLSANSGSSWVDVGNFMVSINATEATAVPEPGTWAAAVLLAAGAALTRWRKRAKDQTQVA